MSKGIILNDVTSQQNGGNFIRGQARTPEPSVLSTSEAVLFSHFAFLTNPTGLLKSIRLLLITNSLAFQKIIFAHLLHD